MMMLVPMMSAGIRSGVNWMRLKLQVEHLGQRADQQRLAQARHAFEQAWPPTNRHVSTPWTMSSCPTITRPICSLTDV